MPPKNYLQEGMGIISQAVQADQAGNAEQAVQLYMRGIEMLSVARKSAPPRLFAKTCVCVCVCVLMCVCVRERERQTH